MQKSSDVRIGISDMGVVTYTFSHTRRWVTCGSVVSVSAIRTTTILQRDVILTVWIRTEHQLTHYNLYHSGAVWRPRVRPYVWLNSTPSNWLHDAQYIICSGDRVSYWTSPSLWPELQTVGGATWKYNNIIIVSRSQNLYNSSTSPSYAPEELGTRLL